MTKENLIAQLEGAKALTSVVSIDNVIALIQSIEPEVKVEKVFGMTSELVDRLFDSIERCLDYQSDNLADLDSAEFELSYDNRIELSRVNVEVSSIMNHIDSCFQSFIIEEDEEPSEDDGCGPSEEQILREVNVGLGTRDEEE